MDGQGKPTDVFSQWMEFQKKLLRPVVERRQRDVQAWPTP